MFNLKQPEIPPKRGLSAAHHQLLLPPQMPLRRWQAQFLSELLVQQKFLNLRLSPKASPAMGWMSPSFN
jgi:hypothetical protein